MLCGCVIGINRRKRKRKRKREMAFCPYPHPMNNSQPSLQDILTKMLSLMSTLSVAAVMPNVLHLVADDMRPQLGCYDQKQMKTPNLDKLAAQGTLFSHAYTNFAYCAPSRNSFMSGRRPDRTRALNFLSTFRQAPGGEDWVTMPQFFKDNGYFTSAAGKVYHDKMDDPESWTYPSNQSKWINCKSGDTVPPAPIDKHVFCGITNSSEVTYTDDDVILSEGLKRLDLAHASGKPWWVSIGVHRPHTSWRMPVGFYGDELYPGDAVQPPKFPLAAENVPFMSGNWDNSSDAITDPAHICAVCPVPADRSVIYRRWYYAAVTYADHMLGMALDKLAELGVENNTITIFHADHGWMLGEQNEWSKKTNDELSTHIPMIIRVPWKQNSVGKKTDVRMELIDLYKTVADLAGLPANKIQSSVQGQSVASVFENPSTTAFDTKVAYSQIGRCGCYMRSPGRTVQCALGACGQTPLNSTDFNYMGYTMRTSEWRYTTWVSWDNTTEHLLNASWDYPNGQELYDLRGDTGTDFDSAAYSVSLAGYPEHADLVKTLHQQLREAVTKME